jgi:hypothetical protein
MALEQAGANWGADSVARVFGGNNSKAHFMFQND